MTATGTTLRRILARLPLDEAGHRVCAERYEEMARAHRAVADAQERGAEAMPDDATAQPPETP